MPPQTPAAASKIRKFRIHVEDIRIYSGAILQEKM
jgi:hypothetical protein